MPWSLPSKVRTFRQWFGKQMVYEMYSIIIDGKLFTLKMCTNPSRFSLGNQSYAVNKLVNVFVKLWVPAFYFSPLPLPP